MKIKNKNTAKEIQAAMDAIPNLIEEHEKKPISEILEQSKDLNTNKIAEEVLGWVALNVENFIDNTQKMFKIDIVLTSDPDSDEKYCTMPETRKLQNLYMSIPEDEEIVSVNDLNSKNSKKKLSGNKALKKISDCRRELDQIAVEVLKKMKLHKEGLSCLYKRMIFYYEMKAVHNGAPVIQELQGAVDVLKFEYEAFPVGVRVKTISPKDNTSTVKEYMIPEGFTIWIELSFTPTAKQTSLF